LRACRLTLVAYGKPDDAHVTGLSIELPFLASSLSIKVLGHWGRDSNAPGIGYQIFAGTGNDAQVVSHCTQCASLEGLVRINQASDVTLTGVVQVNGFSTDAQDNGENTDAALRVSVGGALVEAHLTGGQILRTFSAPDGSYVIELPAGTQPSDVEVGLAAGGVLARGLKSGDFFGPVFIDIEDLQGGNPYSLEEVTSFAASNDLFVYIQDKLAPGYGNSLPDDPDTPFVGGPFRGQSVAYPRAFWIDALGGGCTPASPARVAIANAVAAELPGVSDVLDDLENGSEILQQFLVAKLNQAAGFGVFPKYHIAQDYILRTAEAVIFTPGTAAQADIALGLLVRVNSSQ